MTPSPLVTPAPCDPHARRSIRGRDPTQATPRLAAARSRTLGLALLALAGLALSVVATPAHAAEGPVVLGTARTFAVLGATTVTNTGPSVISGDVGVSPGTAITGFTPVVVTNGTLHRADAVADQAQADTTTAYDDAARRPTTETVTADLAGQRLDPGVYTARTLALNGTLTLDAHGDSHAVFVFQAGTTLKTGSGSTVSVVNGADPCNVFWQVGSSATLGTTTSFVGTILALTSITAETNAHVAGRLLARNGAVTLDTNTITSTECSTASGSTGGSGTTSGSGTSGGTGATSGSGTSGGTGPTTGADSSGSSTGTAGETGTSAGSGTSGGGTSTGPGSTGGAGSSGTGPTSGAATTTAGDAGSNTLASGADSNTPAGANPSSSSGSSGLPFTGAPIALLLLVGVAATGLGIASTQLGRRRHPR